VPASCQDNPRIRLDTDITNEQAQSAFVHTIIRGSSLKKLITLAGIVSAAAVLLAGSASANHSWGGYHWA